MHSFPKCFIPMWNANRLVQKLNSVVPLSYDFNHYTMCTSIYIYIYIYVVSSTDRPVSFYQNSSVWLDRLDSRSWERNPLAQTPIEDSTIQPRGNLRKRRKFKRFCITIVFVYIYPLNGYQELDSYVESCIMLVANHLLHWLESSTLYIYIYIYMCVCVCVWDYKMWFIS